MAAADPHFERQGIAAVFARPICLMSPKKFDALVIKHFGGLLAEYGFSAAGSKLSTFWRQIENDVYHFILADPMRYSDTYSVKVFYSSPKIDPEFTARFPDSLGIPTDVYCELRPKVGIAQGGAKFPCKDESTFVRGFECAVRPALIELAIPYLDQIRTVEQMLNLARHPYFRKAHD